MSETVGPLQVVVCDVTDAASLAGTMQGAVAVVTCLGAKKSFGRDSTCFTVDCDATLNIWRETVRQGNPYCGPSWQDLELTLSHKLDADCLMLGELVC